MRDGLEELLRDGAFADIGNTEELAITGHTDADPDRCEVTRALVGIRKLTGRLAASAKYGDTARPEVRDALDAAQRRFDAERDGLESVRVI